MLFCSHKARAVLLSVPLSLFSLAHAGGMSGAIEDTITPASTVTDGFHVAGSLSQGGAYFRHSNARSSDLSKTEPYFRWVAPSFAAQFGVSYGKSDVASQWGTHGFNMRGRFNLDYSTASKTNWAQPEYDFIIAHSSLGSLEVGSRLKSSVGGGFVVGMTPMENYGLAYTIDRGTARCPITGLSFHPDSVQANSCNPFVGLGGVGSTRGAQTVFAPAMFVLTGHSEEGSRGVRYTTPGIFAISPNDKGDGLQFFVSSRNRAQTDFGAAYVANLNDMRFKVAGAYTPNTHYVQGFYPRYFQKEFGSYYLVNPDVSPQPGFSMGKARGSEYLASAGFGPVALTGFWAQAFPRNEAATDTNLPANGWANDPHEYGVNASYQDDVTGLGATTVRLAWSEDSVRHLARGAISRKNMRQQHMGVAIEQPIIPNMNVLAGWNMYRIRMPFAISQLTKDLVGASWNEYGQPVRNAAIDIFNADATSKAFNKNQVFILGLEYKVTT